MRESSKKPRLAGVGHARITIKVLAAHLGISHTAVSLALRNHPSISLATKKRVRALAEQMGYRPDPMLRSLVAYREARRPRAFQGVLGWLTNYPTSRGWCVGQQVGYHVGARRRARELGYELADFWLRDPEMTFERLRQVMVTRNIQGLIVAPQPQSRTCIDFFWDDFASVSLGYSLMEPKLHLVMNHQFRNTVALIQTLIQRGYRAIGIAMPTARDERVDHNYLAGYLVGTHCLEGVRSLPPHFPDALEQTGFLAWCREFEPDAVVTEAGSAESLYGWLKGRGKTAEVGIALTNVPYRKPSFSGIDEDPELIGATAIDTVVGMLHRNEFGVPQNARHILIQGTWHEGSTVRSPQTLPATQ